MDVAGASLNDGADINQWTYSGNNNQRWRIESVGSGFYRVVSVNSSKCVDVVGNSTADGVAINQWPCNGQNNQSFTFQQLSTAISRTAISQMTAEQQNVMNVSVYPNPSAAQFTIYQKGIFSYTVKDLLGRILEIGRGVDKLTFGQRFVKGVYLLQVESSNKTKVFKLVKN